MLAPVQTKNCTKCGEDKPLDQFHIKRAARDGLYPSCKPCTNEAHRLRSKAKQWEYNLRYKYGITPEQYDLMLQKQNGKCAICLTKPEGKLHVDHCHETGTVRLLLCHRCNTAIGLLQDDPWIAERAAQYLSRWSDASEAA